MSSSGSHSGRSPGTGRGRRRSDRAGGCGFSRRKLARRAPRRGVCVPAGQRVERRPALPFGRFPYDPVGDQRGPQTRHRCGVPGGLSRAGGHRQAAVSGGRASDHRGEECHPGADGQRGGRRAAEGQVPGDCGEGVHFLSVAYSKIRGNLIRDNSGGILLTDETGPTDHNAIEDNVVTRNATDCGITVPGHNPDALDAAGNPQPSVAGVYDNVIAHNIVTFNGLKGDGAGVLFANASAGTASYNNLVVGNYIAGNGLSGVTMHAHTIGPGQFEDLSGNKIIGNVIGKNNIDGDPLDSPASPEDLQTTGVLVFSGGTPVSVTIARNLISRDAIGIWLSKPVTAHGLLSNVFRHVKTPISAGN